MSIIAELKQGTNVSDWNEPPVRWKWGQAAGKLFDDGQSYAKIGEQVGLGEGDVRHAIQFAKRVSIGDVKRLKKVKWRSILTIITAKTENRRQKLIKAATEMDSVALQRYAKTLESSASERAKPVPRLRGDIFKTLTERADEFAAACDVFTKQTGDAETTPARRKRLIRSLSAVQTAVAAALRAAKKK